jgi:hypothetical protein
MEKDYLVLKRASASRTSGEWREDDFDVIADGVVVGRIFKVHTAPVGTPWMWTLEYAWDRDDTSGGRWPRVPGFIYNHATGETFLNGQRCHGLEAVSKVFVMRATHRATSWPPSDRACRSLQ